VVLDLDAPQSQVARTYFQAAFRVQSAWSIKNPNGDNPNEEAILKPVCFVFDFAPTRALRQLSEYGIGSRQSTEPQRTLLRISCRFCPCWPMNGANIDAD